MNDLNQEVAEKAILTRLKKLVDLNQELNMLNSLETSHNEPNIVEAIKLGKQHIRKKIEEELEFTRKNCLNFIYAFGVQLQKNES